MKLSKVMRVSWLLPLAWIDALRCRKQPFERKYQKLQSWSNRVIKQLGYELIVAGQENIPLDSAVFFVSNHQGTLDPALIVASCPIPMTFISKTENIKLPVFGSWIKTIEVILFDREERASNIYMLREAARNLKAGRSLLIFPEGTRSKGTKMNEFKVGATQPAYLAKSIIVPITLNNAFCIDGGQDRSNKLGITYGNPLSYEEYKNYNQEEISLYLHQIIESNIDEWAQ